ncbi:hypothetical protein BWGOE4_28140 [Bacillus mycoides]|uniref:Uncharacterized protein n=2 Tax=Bacillus cereus group TaxID=86661 RepID=J8A989_BACCE|nr:hypothetical protein IEE_02451 [Bacillus cereus BAG5X1-1]EJV71866.1 hypothetical protein IEM_00476 [Bacillus cereus BAG6O-2]OFD42477.1 hypothetical protein BWGOE2_27470 [Bacillus mycoides]OFD45946.1 hypothetical protein BWGOE1_28060 [Bacillus mycoides]OFD46527.1 hypothetical protein BWGOE3_28570 [Bacillus mycoides]
MKNLLNLGDYGALSNFGIVFIFVVAFNAIRMLYSFC